MTKPSLPRQLWLLTACAVVFQLLFAQAMVASDDFHHHCHEHSHESGHECVVTLMLNGGFDLVVPNIQPVDRPPHPPQMAAVLPIRVVMLHAHQAGGLMEHAPPRGP